MKTHLRLASEVYADLTLATSVGNLCHYGLELSPFPEGPDAHGYVRYQIALNMYLPAYTHWGVTHLSICVPPGVAGNRLHLGESASVVEVAPLQYGGELFTASFYVKQGPGVHVGHPMIADRHCMRFPYPRGMATFHEWIVSFCLQGEPEV
tara:strand:+ start:479 stop:931 length:453 start_codon:yes stop_codon:yes gene_type:complete